MLLRAPDESGDICGFHQITQNRKPRHRVCTRTCPCLYTRVEFPAFGLHVLCSCVLVAVYLRRCWCVSRLWRPPVMITFLWSCTACTWALDGNLWNETSWHIKSTISRPVWNFFQSENQSGSRRCCLSRIMSLCVRACTCNCVCTCVCVCAQKGQKRMGVQLSVIQWFWFGRPFDLFESASWAVPPSL